MPSPTFLPLSTRSVDVHFVRVMSKIHTIAIMGPATAAAFDFLKKFRVATLKMPTWHDENLLTPRQSLQKRGMLALDDVPFEETEEELTKDETHCFEEFLQMWKTHRGGSIVCAEEGEALFQKWPHTKRTRHGPAGHTNHEAHAPQSSGEPRMGISHDHRACPFPLPRDAFQNNVQRGNQKMSPTEAAYMKQYYQAYRQAQRSWVRREGAASEVPEVRPALALGTEVELRMGTPVSPFRSTSDPDKAALADLRVLCEEMADCAESAVAAVWGRIRLGLDNFFARRAQADQAILHSTAAADRFRFIPDLGLARTLADGVLVAINMRQPELLECQQLIACCGYAGIPVVVGVTNHCEDLTPLKAKLPDAKVLSLDPHEQFLDELHRLIKTPVCANKIQASVPPKWPTTRSSGTSPSASAAKAKPAYGVSGWYEAPESPAAQDPHGHSSSTTTTTTYQEPKIMCDVHQKWRSPGNLKTSVDGLHFCLPSRVCKLSTPEKLDRSGNHQKCKHNVRKDTCQTCTPTSHCEHGKRIGRCRVCSSDNFCVHNVRKDTCQTCTPTSHCEHGKRIGRCRVCSSDNFCVHNVRKDTCQTCTPTSHCEHGKRIGRCRVCSSDNFCVHNVRKDTCQTCTPTSHCEHGKRIGRCSVCSSDNFCVHNVRKDTCQTCTPTSHCEHGKRIDRCRACTLENFCVHNARKGTCTKCSPVERKVKYGRH